MGEKEMPQMGILGVSGTTFANAGANAVQELAYTLAASVEYLNALQKEGLEPREIIVRTRWIFSVGPHFTEVSKFRAARLLWRNLLSAYGLQAEDFPPRLHARTGLSTKPSTIPTITSCAVRWKPLLQ